MENLPIEPQLDDIPELRINAMSIASLSEARKWSLFFAILGIIGIVLLVVVAIVMMVVLPSMNHEMGMPIPTGILGFVYLILAAFYLMPVIYLLQFNSKTKAALATRDSVKLGQALRGLMLLFRTFGIITIAIIFLYILFMVGIMVLGAGLMGLGSMF